MISAMALNWGCWRCGPTNPSPWRALDSSLRCGRGPGTPSAHCMGVVRGGGVWPLQGPDNHGVLDLAVPVAAAGAGATVAAGGHDRSGCGNLRLHHRMRVG